MKLQIRNKCSDYDSYRAARVKSLFNVETGADFSRDVELPIDALDWKLGLVVGPSGSGKTSIGKTIFGGDEFIYSPEWPDDKPIVDAIGGNDFDEVTGALASVGLGTVPTWLRPYAVLSNGEKFRCDLARLICEAPDRVVVDEFTSVVDRQIAKIGALAFSKAWRRTKKQCVLLSCHYDIIEWLQPDWVYDTATGQWTGRGLPERPKLELDIWQTDWRYWHLFEPHHYLKLPKMVAATNYVGVIDGELVAHIAFGTRPGLKEARACRMVIMPEWQGAGVGMRFLNAVCDMWLRGENRYSKPMPTMFHTSHPGLCAALRRDQKWRQVSSEMFGGSKQKSAHSMKATQKKGLMKSSGTGFGGHMRAVQGFRYYGQAGVDAAKGKK